jgi:hypothetical protein
MPTRTLKRTPGQDIPGIGDRWLVLLVFRTRNSNGRMIGPH